jgi:hypothetical protein
MPFSHVQIRPDDAFGKQMLSNLEVSPAAQHIAGEPPDADQYLSVSPQQVQAVAGKGLPIEGHQSHARPGFSHEALYRQ